MNYTLSIWHIVYHFFLKYFFYSKFFLICFLQFFFIKCSNNFFTIEIINNISPRNCIFRFTNNRNFFWLVWSVSCSKNVFIFWNSNTVTNFKLRILSLTSFLKSIYVLPVTSIGFILIVLWTVLVYLSTISNTSK